MALDATASGETKISMSIYKPLTSENEDFLDDILDRLQGPKHIFESVLEAAQEGAYDMPENGKAKGRNRKHSHIERLISRGDVFASINEILNAALFLM